MTDQEKERRRKLDELISFHGYSPYEIESVWCNCVIHDILSLDQIDPDEEFSFIGRVISIRQSFLTLRYMNEDLQIYVSKKDEDIAEYFQKFVDLGDHLHISGVCFRTQKNVLTVKVKEAKIISKCLNYFPSQYYGINSDELKYKDRVGKSLSSSDFFNNIYLRSKIISELRGYLNERDYVELETPILELMYGGANAVPFTTYCQSLKQDFFLRIATEISLKKLVISGFPRVYEIGKVFRNEGADTSHNPEFTSLEIYTVNIEFQDLIRLSEEIIHNLARKLEINEVVVNDHRINIIEPFARVSMSELVKEKTGIDFYNGQISLEEAISLADKFHLKLRPFERTIGHIFHKLFDDLISDNLIQPTIVYGFHKDVSPLSKTDPNNRAFTNRYELFIGGMEFANGFSELNDPDEQLSRFQLQVENRKLGNEEAFEMDDSFIFSLKYGLPPTGGLGIGVDRLVMLFAQASSIRDVLFSPIVANK